MRLVSGFAAASLSMTVLAACGSKPPPPAPPPKVEVAKPKPPPPPPPVCVKAGAEMSAIGSPSADAAAASFCVSDGAESNECFSMDLATGKLAKASAPSAAQQGALGETHARVETTATEVKVCVGEACKTFKPAVPKGSENPIEAVANADGTLAVVLSGDAEKGKGAAEIWDVAKGKKVIAAKYAKADYKCGHARVLGSTIFVSADVCAGPAARGTLFTAKGKKLADVGGKDFGTYGTEPIQVTETEWAFLEETGAAIAIQDVKTGKVVKTIELGAAWGGAAVEPEAAPPEAPEEEKAPPPAKGDKAEAKKPAPPAAAPALGNPGESAMVRGGEGKLVVITGGPNPGHVALVDVASGEVQVVSPLGCK
ncbi:MAG: hypothetical protein K8W52_15555 [Deltaproteobacteria bacterium]|nr:hypothetical protein [Deltaproteobacteria bacterium]